MFVVLCDVSGFRFVLSVYVMLLGCDFDCLCCVLMIDVLVIAGCIWLSGFGLVLGSGWCCDCGLVA